MPADRSGTDPGLLGEDPSDEALVDEDAARSAASVAELVERDLDDPVTPSRRRADAGPEPGSFDVLLEELDEEASDAGQP